MADRVFCIDFGSAYTKVALRRDPTADSELLACGVEVDFWLPTVVVVDRRGMEPKLEFGSQAAGRVAGGGIDVHTDFKKHLFAPAALQPDKPALPPLEALLNSPEFEALAAQYSVATSQIESLRMIVSSARALGATPGERSVPLTAHRQANAAKIACHYFHWLRKQVIDACAKLPVTGLKFEDIPVRVSIPALNGDDVLQQPGCKLLREALHRAGWPLHPELPFVSEPEANAVGILTKAGNYLFRTGRINLGEMFSKGPLITVLKGNADHPTYRALVIDVGAFTTDFASLFVDTKGQNVVSELGAGFTVKQQSIPLGITQLDTRVQKAISAEKKDWLTKLPPKEFTKFQKQTYSDGRGYRVPGLGIIGGEEDREVVESCLTTFAKELANEALKFTADLEPANMQELILTGGGSNIPAVREALIEAAKVNGTAFANTHAPDLKRTKAGPPVDKLGDHFTRGGSALGGASIYFEKSYY